MTADELDKKYSGQQGGAPSLLRTQYNLGSGGGKVTASSLDQKYGVQASPSGGEADRGVFADTLFGNLAKGLVSVVPKTGIEIGQATGLLNPNQQEFNIPFFGKTEAANTPLQKAGLTLDQILTFLTFGGSKLIKGGLDVGGALIKGSKEAKAVLEAEKAAKLLKAKGYTEEGLKAASRDLASFEAGISPKVGTTGAGVGEAELRASKAASEKLLREQLARKAAYPAQAASIPGEQITDNPLIDTIIKDIKEGSEVAKREALRMLAEDPLPDEHRKLLMKVLSVGDAGKAGAVTAEQILSDVNPETPESILKKMLGGTEKDAAARLKYIAGLKRDLKAGKVTLESLSDADRALLESSGKVTKKGKGVLDEMLKTTTAGETEHPKLTVPAEPITPEVIPEIDKPTLKALKSLSPAQLIAKATKALNEEGLTQGAKDAISKHLGDIAGVNKKIDDAIASSKTLDAAVKKALEPYAPELVKAAKKTVFYADLINSSLLGGGFGLALGLEDKNATPLSVISSTMQGVAGGAAFPILGATIGKVSSLTLEPLGSKLGDWVRSTKAYDNLIGQTTSVLDKLDSAGGTGRKIAQAFRNARDFGNENEARDLAKLIPKIKNLTDEEMDRLVKEASGATTHPNLPSRQTIIRNAQFNNLSDEELAKLLKERDSHMRVGLALDAWRSITNGIGSEAERLKFMLRSKDIATGKELPPRAFKRIRDYFPQFLDTDSLRTKKGFDKAIESLVTNRGVSREDATKFLLTTISGEEQPEIFAQIIKESGFASKKSDIEANINQYYNSGTPRRNGSLEYARQINLPDELIVKDPRVVMTRYIGEARRRLAQAQTFGVDNELLYRKPLGNGKASGIVENIKNPYEHDLALKIIRRVLGTEPVDAASAAGSLESLRSLNTFSMGLSQIKNISQSVNTITVAGLNNFRKGLMDMFSKEGQDFVAKSGAVLDDTIREMLGGTAGTQGEHRLQDWFMNVTKFSLSERVNRTLASSAGKNYFLELGAKLVKNPEDAMTRARFWEVGLNPDDLLKDSKGFVHNMELGLQDPRLLHAARKFTESTQFLVQPQDLPLWWSSDVGRLFTQFKSFSFKQAQFIKNQVMAEAGSGNFKPMLGYLVASQAFGEPAADVLAILKGDKKRKDLIKDFYKPSVQRTLDNMLTVGGLGLFSDAVYSAGQGNFGTTRFLLGPSLSNVADIAGRIGSGVKGVVGGKGASAFKPLSTYAAGKVPVVGPLISNIMKGKATESDIPILGQFLGQQ